MKVYEISFSPTGGTRKAALAVAEALSDTVVSVDLADSAFDFGSVRLDAGDVAVIAAPAYGGRVPAVAIQRLAQIQGNGAWAILMAVYGNRAFEDTLVELEDTAKAAGFSGLGMLKEGYRADFAVLSESIFSVSPEQADEIRVLQTYMDGICVYNAIEK